MQPNSWVETEKDIFSIEVIDANEDEYYLQLMKKNKNASFYLYDYSKVEKNYMTLKNNFPNVPLFFDVKVNNDSVLISQLCSLQLSFNCFNYHEAFLVRKFSTNSPIGITNSVLNELEIAELASLNVSFIRIGSIEQVDLIKKHLPEVKVIIDTSKTRFGVNAFQAAAMLKKCKEESMQVVGIYTDEQTFDVVDKMIGFYTELLQKNGFALEVVFIDEVLLAKEPKEINKRSKLRINCSRSLCKNYLTCFDWIMQSKIDDEKKKIHYHVLNLEFINGIYFEDQEHFTPSDRFIKEEDKKYLMSIYGPTCDGSNYLVRDYPFKKLDEKDLNYIIVENIGCDSMVFGGSKFNGFDFVNDTLVHRVYNQNTFKA